MIKNWNRTIIFFLKCGLLIKIRSVSLCHVCLKFPDNPKTLQPAVTIHFKAFIIRQRSSCFREKIFFFLKAQREERELLFTLWTPSVLFCLFHLLLSWRTDLNRTLGPGSGGGLPEWPSSNPPFSEMGAIVASEPEDWRSN